MKASFNSVQPIDVIVLNQSLSVKPNQKVSKARQERAHANVLVVFFFFGVTGRQMSLQTLPQPAAILNAFSEKTTGGS